jgi:monoamine oxidase
VPVHDQYLDGAALEDRPGVRRRLTGNPLDVPSYRYTHGAQSVAEALAATLPPGVVRLGTAGAAIRCGHGSGRPGRTGVTCDAGSPNRPNRPDRPGRTGGVVHTRGGQSPGRIRTAQVIMAVPPALAVHAIAFHPGLSEELFRLARLTPVWMGATTKVVAQFSRPFWRTEGLAGAAVSYTGPLREIHDMSGPGGRPAALFGFAPALPGNAVVTHDEVVEQLVRLLGPLAASPVDILIQNWATEDYTSPPNVASLNAYQLFGHPMYAEPALGGCLHWATTETARESPGHVEGALAGAERAVAGVLASLGLPAADGLAVPGRSDSEPASGTQTGTGTAWGTATGTSASGTQRGAGTGMPRRGVTTSGTGP